MRYCVYGKVVGSIYMGEFEADSPEEAKEKANESVSVCLCHHCSDQCEDPEAEAMYAEPIEEPKPKRSRRK